MAYPKGSYRWEGRERLRKETERVLRAEIDAEIEAERMFELRAAYGPGETIVNILTGETYRT